ncbi:hypothetical protein [Bradyrhizobium sp. SZCCHNS3002]|uniref:hypothetical protein n=1 Tax=Bradyrhizobium sp. SZCCHNS3002 TaxID=3057310 RepID=UPI0028F0E199|nr:hypothetical protein [Bradyrhizobium sp. SZCCHNS3002]
MSEQCFATTLEEVLTLRSELVSLREALEEEQANAGRAWRAWENLKAQLAGSRKAAIEECMEQIGSRRQSEAGLFDAAHSGQRGEDRSTAFYDAYQMLRKLALIDSQLRSSDGQPSAGGMQMPAPGDARNQSLAHPKDTISGGPVGPSDAVERHPGPWIGPDAELARACAMAAIKDYGDDDPATLQRILRDGVWNDHVAVQAALAAIHHLRKTRA